jgi:5-methyltetrahydrofolate--homocysteine methyltransferase
MTDDQFAQMRQAIIDGDPDHATELARRALDDGVPPLAAIEEGFVPGLTTVGEQFARGDLFLPDMMLAARAMQRAVALLEPEMRRQATARHVTGTVILGTVKGDIHEIGKNLVGMMLSCNGFAVHDLGVDVTPERFVAAAREAGTHVVGLSALLSTTLPAMTATVRALTESGVRPRVKIVVGGAPVTARFAAEIGADAYAESAAAAVDVVRGLVASPGGVGLPGEEGS